MAEMVEAVRTEREIPRLLRDQGSLVSEIQEEIKRLAERCDPVANKMSVATPVNDPGSDTKAAVKAETALGSNLTILNKQLEGIINALRDIRMSIEL